MQSKTLSIWRDGKPGSELQPSAYISFICNGLEHEPGFYILKNAQNQVVARIQLSEGCKWKELGSGQ